MGFLFSHPLSLNTETESNPGAQLVTATGGDRGQAKCLAERGGQYSRLLKELWSLSLGIDWASRDTSFPHAWFKWGQGP